jgi:hypothetical protein
MSKKRRVVHLVKRIGDRTEMVAMCGGVEQAIAYIPVSGRRLAY